MMASNNLDFSNNNEIDPVAHFLAEEKKQLAEIDPDVLGDETGDFFSSATTSLCVPPEGGEPQLCNLEGFETENDQSYIRDDAIAFESSEQQHQQKVVEEPEKIKRWRIEMQERLEKKDAEEEKKKREWLEIAKKELEDWHKQQDEQLRVLKAQNRAANKSQDDADLSTGTQWERVAKLCDLNSKNPRAAAANAKDVSRMRALLLSLKQNPPKRS